jgi:hypothetical protein
MQQCENSWI